MNPNYQIGQKKEANDHIFVVWDHNTIAFTMFLIIKSNIIIFKSKQ